MKDISSDTESIKVMIIEDEEAHFQLMKRAIRKELFRASVCHSNSATECFQELDSINPDIILVDFLLPDMTGIEFLAAIKGMSCDIPVIMITGQGDEGIAVRAMKLGAQDYLVKNSDFFLLLPSVIRQVIRERKLNRNLRRLSRLNESLLDSLPYPAMMIRKDRLVLAANRIAHELNVRVGGYCRQSFRFDSLSEKQQIKERECSFCRKNEMFQLKKSINTPEITVNGRIYDIWWIPIDHEIFLHYAIDITDRKMAEYKLLISSRFLEIANRHEDTKSLLQDFVIELKSIIGCCMIAAWLLNIDGSASFIVNEGGDRKLLDQVIIPHMSLGASPTGEFTNHTPDLITTLLPIHLEERTLGWIFLADTKKSVFPPETIEIAAIGAMKLAAAIDRIQSRELLKKSEQTLHFLSDRLMNAQEEERKRISRDLHDSIGSSLCAIHLSLSLTLQDKLKRKPLEKILSLTQNAIDEVRRIISDLRPSFLDEIGIVAALNWFCEEFAEIHPDIDIKQQIEIQEHDVPDSLKIVILRIVQESFNNISKYSHADIVSLNLIKKDGTIQLYVHDNGIGFNPDSVCYGKNLRTGIGLLSMKERAELSGGSFTLESHEGKGTSIAASWPLLSESKAFEFDQQKLMNS
jgi:signal transduction histidine kinase/DNA-binding NarL/FixJ family response regulator